MTGHVTVWMPRSVVDSMEFDLDVDDAVIAFIRERDGQLAVDAYLEQRAMRATWERLGWSIRQPGLPAALTPG